jgi:hypothetical protein
MLMKKVNHKKESVEGIPTTWLILKKINDTTLGGAILRPLGVGDTLDDIATDYADATTAEERTAAIERGNRQLRKAAPAGAFAHLAVLWGFEQAVILTDGWLVLGALVWYITMHIKFKE